VARKWCSKPIRIAEPNDVLISVRAPVGPVNIAAELCCIGRGLAALRPKSRLDYKFLFFYLRLREPEVSHLGQGSTFTAIDKDTIEELLLPLPSLEMQKVIVSRMEFLDERLEEARRLNDKRILETRALIPSEIHRIWKDSGRWDSKRLGDIAQVVSGQVDARVEPYVSMAHINGETIESGTCRLLRFRTAREDGMISKKYHFKAGSILYSKIRPYLQKAVQVPVEGVCSADIYAFDTISVNLKPRFLMYSLVSPQFTEYANRLSKRTRIPKLNKEQLYTYGLRYPTLPEQERIVNHLDSLQPKVSALTAMQQRSSARLVSLESSILEKAFSGEPVK
jgi:type I restriction enzyme S subunit